MGQTLVEKIVQKHALGLKESHKVKTGEFISIRPAYVMTHDNTGAVIPKFHQIGATKLAFPNQVVHTLDHNIQDTSEKNLEKYRNIEKFSREMGADFYPAGRGIGHQIMCEEGYAWPGTMVVASDSHSNMYGGLGVLGTPIVRTDAASIWATGKTWWQIPPTVKVELKGKLNTGVKGKDVIIALCGFFNNDEVLNHAIEFCGDGVDYLSVDQRLTIANMTTEWGALVGLFPIDFRTITWLENRISDLERKDERGTNPRLTHDKLATLKTQMFDLVPDKDAFYSKELSIDLSSIEPHVSGPNSVKVMSPISALRDQKLKVNKAYLVSCVNSRFEDIKEAADILKYKKISKNVKFYIAAASSEVQKRAENEGDWQVL
ncbi:MAG: homoaconitase, partial [Melioribacteraceae bacterium]|nr:homoaconitase [Melioribacteraceae bacterium]